MDKPDRPPPLPWGPRWAKLTQALVRELAPEALPPLRTAFNAHGARSMREFFDLLEAEFTGPDCVAKLEILVLVLSEYQVDAVLALRPELSALKADPPPAEPAPLLGFPPLRPAGTLPRRELPALVERIASARPGARIALVGMGGVGKSTLALAAVSDPRVSSQFSLVYWISLREKIAPQERVSLLSGFVRNAWPTQPVPAAREVRDLVPHIQALCRLHSSAKPPLVVLDNVWSKEDIAMFENVPLTLVLTTRIRTLVEPHASAIVEVALLRKADQDRMLLDLSQVPADRDPEGRAQVLARCGGLPLVVNVVARMVYKRKADEPWQDALRLFHSHRVGNTAPTEGDATVYASLLAGSASLGDTLAAHWSSLCVFPAELWVPEALVHLLWREKEAGLDLPDVHERLEDLYERGLVELNRAASDRLSVRLHAVMGEALVSKLGDAGASTVVAQLNQMPPLSLLKLIWKEDWRTVLNYSPYTSLYIASLLQDAGYTGWRAIPPAQIEAMARSTNDESAAALITLCYFCEYPQEQWVAALQSVEPSLVLQRLESGSTAVLAMDNWYTRWPEVLALLSPATVRGLVRQLNFVVHCGGLAKYERWGEVWALMEPADLEAMLVMDALPFFLDALKERGWHRWDMLPPAAVAKFLQSGSLRAFRIARWLEKVGYTRWAEVDELTGPEIAQGRKSTQPVSCAYI